MIYIKITRSDTDGSYIQPLDDIQYAIDAELDGAAEWGEPGTKITLELVEMSEEEYEALPEFTGW